MSYIRTQKRLIKLGCNMVSGHYFDDSFLFGTYRTQVENTYLTATSKDIEKGYLTLVIVKDDKLTFYTKISHFFVMTASKYEFNKLLSDYYKQKNPPIKVG
jgi:hypothetical protein